MNNIIFAILIEKCEKRHSFVIQAFSSSFYFSKKLKSFKLLDKLEQGKRIFICSVRMIFHNTRYESGISQKNQLISCVFDETYSVYAVTIRFLPFFL